MSREGCVFESLHADFESKLSALSADLQIAFRDETKTAALCTLPSPPPRFFGGDCMEKDHKRYQRVQASSTSSVKL